MITVPCHHLNGPKNRRYTFTPLGNDTVLVKRFEGHYCAKASEQTTTDARNLYKWLVSLGYQKW